VGKARRDPVTQYAIDVLAGTIVAARLVRLACQRHLNDQAQASAKGLEWRPEAAQAVIDFFAEILCLPENTDATDTTREDDDEVTTALEGKPFVLSAWQAFIAGSCFGWYTTQGHRRFRIAYLEIGKGSGKTPMCAGFLLYMLVADGERGQQLFCAAVTLKQAGLAFTDATRMVQASPALRDLIDQKVNNLAVLETGSFIRPISAEKRGLDGMRVGGAVIDEEHEHPTPQVYLKIRAGTKGRRNAIVFIPTNSGFDLESVCWTHHDYSRQVLEGLVTNESWFAFVCHLDACDRCHAAGKLQPADDCPDCDSWKIEGPHWLKANPNLGVSLPWSYLREQVVEALALPSQRNMVRRLNFCQWTAQAVVFIPPEAWAACAGPVTLASMHGRACYLGIDLSDKIDLSSVVAIFPKDMARDVTIEQQGERIPVDRAIDVLPYFWMPAKSIVRRAAEDKVPYPQWEKDGHLTATIGSMVDHDAIVDFIITILAKAVQIKRIGIDQAGASAVITRLRRHFGEEFVIEVPQGFRRLNTPTRMIEALVMSQNLAHPDNPVMNMCLGNLATEENSWREIRPVKISARKRIDGGVALIDAEFALLETPFQDPSVYASRGVRNLGDFL